MVLKAPLQVDFNLTKRCNLHCVYCYASSANYSTKEELTLEEISKLFQVFAKIGVLKLALSGGEPLLRKDFLEILHLIPSCPFSSVLLTNGSLLNNEISKEIKKSGIDWVRIGLEGPNAKINDLIRQTPGSFDKTIHGITSLNKYRIPFIIGMTINSQNINYVFEMAKLTKSLGGKFLILQILCPTGRAFQNKNIFPSFDRFTEFFNKLTTMKKQKNLPIEIRISATNESPVLWEYYFPLERTKQLTNLLNVWGMDTNFTVTKNISCVAGKIVCSISAEGGVFPCEMFLSEPNMCLGNIRNLSFSKIWKNAPLLKKLRSLKMKDLEKPCQNCSNYWCGGGCRAAALFLTGSIKGADKHCYYAQ